MLEDPFYLRIKLEASSLYEEDVGTSGPTEASASDNNARSPLGALPNTYLIVYEPQLRISAWNSPK